MIKTDLLTCIMILSGSLLFDTYNLKNDTAK